MTLSLLFLAGCSDIWFELPGKDEGDTAAPDTADADTDTDTDRDTDRPDTDPPDTDTDTAPAVCAPASWFWGGTNTSESADASFVGQDPQGWAGGALLAPGDMDGDGVADLVVGAPYENVGGVVYFLVGGIARATGQLLDGHPSILGPSGEQFSQLADLGDVDGDGLADVALVPGWSTPSDGGQWLMRGRVGGWPVGGDPAVDTDARVTNTNNPGGWTDVRTLGPLGDHDGDGLDDWLLVGSGINMGEAHVVRGVDAVGDIDIPATDRMWVYGGTEQMYVQGSGDFDGDGLADLVARDREWTTLYFLFAASVGTAYDARIVDVAPATLEGDNFSELRVLDDLDGDGADEFATSVVRSDIPSETGVYVFMGGAGWSGPLTLADADLHIGPGEYLYNATWLGDLDGDGLPELGVVQGSPSTDAYVFLGRTSWPAELALADADVHISGDSSSGDWFRLPDLDMLGDINGDGLGDLVTRIPYEGSGSLAGAGRISVYLGRTTWPAELGAGDADVTFVGDVMWQSMGDNLVVADLDADGCDDLITGSYYHPVPTAEGEVFVHFGQSAP